MFFRALTLPLTREILPLMNAAVADAVAKMQTLSEERAARVVSMIEDLAELEARENAEDLAAAREALANIAD